MYIPIGDMQNLEKNKNYDYDYGHSQLFETKMGPFTIIHFNNKCKCEPNKVTYMLFCPKCSKYGNPDSITSSYLQTKYSNLRFYLSHSIYECSINKKQFLNFPSNFNLLCDQCYEMFY